MMHLTSVDLPAPFSPSSAWNEPGSTMIDTSSSATSGPKILVMPTVCSDGARTAAGVATATLMADSPRSSSSSTTEPNTPPCIFTILIAARWLPGSVAPQQSSSSRHSKPRSLASRMVVCTQTSVVMPVSTMLRKPRVRSISSRSVAQNEPLPGLSMIGSPAFGASSGMISQPGSPRTRIRPHGPGSPMPALIRRERQRLLSGRSARSGRWPSRVWMMV